MRSVDRGRFQRFFGGRDEASASLAIRVVTRSLLVAARRMGEGRIVMVEMHPQVRLPVPLVEVTKRVFTWADHVFSLRKEDYMAEEYVNMADVNPWCARPSFP